MKKWIEVLGRDRYKITVVLEDEEEAQQFTELLQDGVSMMAMRNQDGCPWKMLQLAGAVVESVRKAGTHIKDYANRVKINS